MKKFEEIAKNDGAYTLDQVEGLPLNGLPLPGRFYHFKIDLTNPDLNKEIAAELNYGKGYYDPKPTGLVLYHENWQQTTLILNLKVIPSNISAKILEAFYYISSQNGFETLFKNGELIPLSERQLLDKRFYLITTTLLSQLTGLNNLNYAINKYNVNNIREVRLIDWDKFGLLVRPIQSTSGIISETINLTQVFEKFINNSI